MSESPKCYTVTSPKARKEHRCCECFGVIQKGEPYERYSGIWDYAATFKTCSDCADERDRLIKTLRSSGYYDSEDIPAFEHLYEDLSEWDDSDFMRVVEIFKKRGSGILEWHGTKKRIQELEANV